MTYSYNSLLVIVSILVAIVGAYACFDLIIRVQRSEGVKRRQWLALASLAIGGSIWSMHFIAMVAVQLDMSMQYDKLLTLVSGLASILMTAVALGLVSSVHVSHKRILLGGVIMGIGIVSMHYVGMSGMRGNFQLIYEPFWVGASVLIGIVASTMSLWIVMALRLHGVLRRLVSAVVMGSSIAGVHYCGMFGTSFEPIAKAVPLTRPYLDPFSLGAITALVTFALLAWTLLSLLPDTPSQGKGVIGGNAQPSATFVKTDTPALSPQGNIALTTQQSILETIDTRALSETKDSAHTQQSIAQERIETIGERIPVQRNKETHFLDIANVMSISADGHYCTIKTADATEHFCNIAFNKLLDNINTDLLVRVHRSHAVNLNHVVSFQRQHDKGILSMGDDKHKITVSRSHVPMIKAALGLSKKMSKS